MEGIGTEREEEKDERIDQVKMKTVAEKVLTCHFVKIELLVVLKLPRTRSYFDKFLGELTLFHVGVTCGSKRGQIFRMLKMA